MTNRRKVTASLTEDQFKDLEALMKEDGATGFTAYIVYLVSQEKKHRLQMQAGFTAKGKVGRPKKEAEPEDTNLYPAPYKGGAPYTKDQLEAYYAFRKQEVPPLPAPLTAEELKKYE